MSVRGHTSCLASLESHEYRHGTWEFCQEEKQVEWELCFVSWSAMAVRTTHGPNSHPDRVGDKATRRLWSPECEARMYHRRWNFEYFVHLRKEKRKTLSVTDLRINEERYLFMKISWSQLFHDFRENFNVYGKHTTRSPSLFRHLYT